LSCQYRRVDFYKYIDETFVEVCLDTSKRYEILFLEIDMDKDPVHFLLQSVPTESATSIVKK